MSARRHALPASEAGAPAPVELRDVDEAAAWYGEQAGLALELAFADALESAVKMLMQRPGVGSSRHAVLLKLQDLRVWPPKGFPI